MVEKMIFTQAFKKLSKSDKIEIGDMRIKVMKNNGSLNYSLLNKTESIRSLRFDEFADNPLFALLGGTEQVEKHIYHGVKNMITAHNLNENRANLRVFVGANEMPSAYLFDNDKILNKIDLTTLLKLN